jgi:serine phosphatase RsbU (regulator of sigma subunit)
MRNASDQSRYDDQFEQQLDTSFRRSFLVLCAGYFVLAFGGLIYVASAAPKAAWEADTWRIWLRLGLLASAGLLAACFLLWNRRRNANRTQLMTAITALVIIVGSIMLGSRLLMQPMIPHLASWGLGDVLALHLVACLLLPWRVKDCFWPFAPLLLLWIAIVPAMQSEWDGFQKLVTIIVSPAVLVPGALIAAWRFKRSEEDFDREMLGQQVQSIGGEMSRARIIHDAMFPKSADTGNVIFEYEYVPMYEIGGDYVHLHHCRDSGRVYMTLLDVAGHGLAAALTVNRLFGELERIRAENPDAEPADVMELLNRYINLTMAPYNLYATGTCILIDPNTGELKWVTAGHPPGIVRRVAGEIATLPGTTMLLGAQSYAEFMPNQQTMKLSPGDVVIVYTDGAFEARDKFGKRFGIERLRETAGFNPPPRSWPRFLATAVQKHADDAAEDDLLIASLRFCSYRITELPTSAIISRPAVMAIEDSRSPSISALQMTDQ